MIKKLFAHAAIVLAGIYCVLYPIDRVNAAMQFIDHDLTKALLLVLCLLTFVNSAVILSGERRREKRLYERRRMQERTKRAPQIARHP